MTTAIAHSVVDLNNNALTHFLNGDYDSAIAMLKIAFQTFAANAETAIEKNENSGNIGEDSGSVSRPSLNFAADRGVSTSQSDLPTMMDCEVDTVVKEKASRCLNQVEKACSVPSSPGTAFSMYNRALVLSRDQDDYSLVVKYRHRTSAIILYNLALVHHNIGVHLGVSAALPHALQLYEMAQSEIDRGANFVDVQKLLLALYNNMSNIHTHLFHFDNASRCLSSLRVVLAASSNSTMAMDDDYLFFFLNALFQGKELNFAPAA